jgi:hypothetical protein
MNRLMPHMARSDLRHVPGPGPAPAPDSVRAWWQRKNLRAMGAREVATAAWAKLVFERIFPLFEHVGLHVLPIHFYSPVPDSRQLRKPRRSTRAGAWRVRVWTGRGRPDGRTPRPSSANGTARHPGRRW